MSSSSLWVRLRPFRRCFFTHSRALVIAPKSKDEQGHVEDKWKTMIFDEKSATGFENTTTLELLRAAVVVRLSANDYISNNAITVSLIPYTSFEHSLRYSNAVNVSRTSQNSPLYSLTSYF